MGLWGHHAQIQGVGSPSTGVGGGVTMHGCRGWGQHAWVPGVGSACTGAGAGSPCMGAGGGVSMHGCRGWVTMHGCMGAEEVQQVMTWFNRASVTSQPLH